MKTQNGTQYFNRNHYTPGAWRDENDIAVLGRAMADRSNAIRAYQQQRAVRRDGAVHMTATAFGLAVVAGAMLAMVLDWIAPAMGGK